ncbi:MAG: FecR domain-containing protein [Myxococcota bacterium]
MSPESPPPEELIATLGHDWDDARVDRSAAHVRRKIRAQDRRRRAAQVGALVAVAAAIALVLLPRDRPAAKAPLAKTDPGIVRLADGSTATPLNDGNVIVAEVSETRAELVLHEGAAVFDVTPNPSRRFRVTAENVVVEVIGTRFRVDRLDDAIEVRVFEGIVRASQGDDEVELRANRAHRFRLGEVASDELEETTEHGVVEHGVIEHGVVEPRATEHEVTEPTGRREPARTRRPETSWRELAENGEFERAYRTLQRATAPRSVPDLMLAADAARFSGHPRRALTFLRAVHREHAGDPRAPLAAFTEGRILLLQLGRPQEAADAFATTRRLAPRSSLAEDALAREVEARSRAGSSAAAQRLARRYLELYPSGRRTAAVRHHAGLD